jgi:hypothetical protein
MNLKNRGIPGPINSNSSVLQNMDNYFLLLYLPDDAQISEFSSLGPTLHDSLCS